MIINLNTTVQLLILLIVTMEQPILLFDFKTNSNTKEWQVVDDVVMGGKSSGHFYVAPTGHGVFEGHVSLENNGGFSMLRYRFDKINTHTVSKLILRVQGDGKRYQFRIKRKSSDYYSYVTYFDTTKEWQDISIRLLDLYPTFRGRKLDMPNYDGSAIEEIAFLIANQKAETFVLKIDALFLH
ncbi:CIA30 family protein [Oceanihabitans sp. 2_MG-2023]|uniref:CIA30 family protein n=1 Tax=Oceanihabitans sp. 2_MG-2023 TaxID=3062661 RepID=UPI0026E3C073|nr:CIA30 family protein [Oceanihabitans sp. 2_MG-2023]MDO6597261.1 CIA30 family protein [Oceanihabitans sp. 2_MG-2023]